LSDGRFGLVIADVSGKGMSAALLVCMLQGMFWATAASGFSPAEVARRVNIYVCDRSTSDKFATLFYGILEPAGRFCYVNAGHNPPMLVAADGTVRLLAAENLPIGMFPAAEYIESEVQFDPGATLVLYTDGVTEAMNSEQEMFGDERLQELLTPSATQNVEQLRDRLLRGVRGFVAGHPQSDDITVVVAKRN
jgi:sigma-B regulation protein RsbU (phosphoserine phosphatase)